MRANHFFLHIFPMKPNTKPVRFGECEDKITLHANELYTAVPSLTSKASPPALRWWDWPKVSRIHRSWIERHGRWRWERERMVLPGEI